MVKKTKKDKYPAPTEAQLAILEQHIAHAVAMRDDEAIENGDRFRHDPEKFAENLRAKVLADNLEGSLMRENILHRYGTNPEQGRK